ncbi:Neuropeptide Y receptor [Orchesella cincta]|uniref:Neuropeptide Y receptor n=1 Tax=Orchesella cincta TaxID=48709 RepID=A0A1D2NFS6_ORCCI|nr:Neuropeptide Y receptor [Orchesella cincta]
MRETINFLHNESHWIYNTTEVPFGVENGTEDEEEWDWLWGDEAPFIFPKSFQIAAHILYNIILILGIIGNGCVVLIFTFRKLKIRKLPTPLLANLAVGDLLITVFCLETSYLSLLWQYWPFGQFLCFALSPVKPIAVFVSCYTLIALSVDRYMGVKNPLSSRISNKHVKWTIALVWILAVFTAIPTGLFTAYEIHILTGLPRCGEYAWESEMKEMIYDLSLITLQFLIPVIVLIYTYTRISIVVCRNRAVRHRMSQGTSPKQKSLRTVRMSLMVVMGYCIGWFPYNLVSLLAKYTELGESDNFPYVFVACHWLAMSHSVYNPIIYFWLNDSFRITVLELFCRKRALEMKRRRMSSSWRTSTMVASGNGSIKRPTSRVTPLQSPEPYSRSESPLLRIPNTFGDRFQKNKDILEEMEEIMIKN